MVLSKSLYYGSRFTAYGSRLRGPDVLSLAGLEIPAGDRSQTLLRRFGDRVPVGQDGVLQGPPAAAGPSGIDAGDGRAHGLAGGGGVLREHREDRLDRDRRCLRAPAVVVGHERERGVTDLGLAGELRLCQIRHADHIRAPRSIEIRLGPRRKLMPFDANVVSTRMDRDPRLDLALPKRGRERGTNRIGEADMRDDPF